MTSYVPIILSLVSLIISALVAYRAELRGPSLTVRIRLAPQSWAANGGRQTAGRPPGYSSLALFEEAAWIQMAGECQATVDNDGPKGGALWDVALSMDGLAPPWSTGGSFPAQQPLSLDGKASVGLRPGFIAWCPRESIAEGAATLRADARPITLILRYHSAGVMGMDRTRRATIRIERRLLQAALNSYLEENAVSLGIDE